MTKSHKSGRNYLTFELIFEVLQCAAIPQKAILSGNILVAIKVLIWWLQTPGPVVTI